MRSCRTGDGQVRLTPRSEVTPFALCFAIFGYWLLKESVELERHGEYFAEQLRRNLFDYKREREPSNSISNDKPFLQLLAFTLSGLYLLGRLQEDPLEELIVPLLPDDIAEDLKRTGALRGIPQSGNMAMFMAILLIHARDYLGIDTGARIEEWVELHLKAMNARGFWGNSPGMTYLEFQNGYHQYEILEYLNVENPKSEQATACVEHLADREGHFGPYPGGGGCYDYDAVSILTGRHCWLEHKRRELLQRTLHSILREQNADGGFGESHYIRPRSLRNLMANLRHIAVAERSTRFECLRYGLTLQRPRHNRIHTHWSRYPWEWGESDLWNSWFRMLAVARISCATDTRNRSNWGFISYPGLGFYHGA
ncbi:MAG: hypothetical protein PHT49_00195 [Desulfovibrionales bacterium]|nr:hypothetical protein [Desulfovibrionales bacterium]